MNDVTKQRRNINIKNENQPLNQQNIKIKN